MIDERQRVEGWGAAVILRLARELKNELPEEKGFSERNIGRMIAFCRSYPEPAAFLPRPAEERLTPQNATGCGKTFLAPRIDSLVDPVGSPCRD